MKIKNSFLLSSIIFSIVLLFTCQEKIEPENSVEVKPNVLLIIIDDQGYADFEPFNNSDPSIHTPNLARLGRKGTSFSQAYVTAPVCSPSRAGLITGKNQFRWDTNAGWGPGLPDSVKTLAEYLRESGYKTAKIGKNDLGRNFHKNDVREYPLNHGFDEFLGFSAHAHDYWHNSQTIKDRTPDPYGTSALLGPLMHNMGEKSYEEGYLTDILTDEALNYLQGNHNEPFFLTLSYSAVHHLIHEVPEKYLKKYGAKPIANYDPDSLLAFKNHKAGSYSAYYDKYSRVGDIKAEELRSYYLANLNCTDENIGRIIDYLESSQLDKNTIVIFLSDNGGSPLTGANNTPLTAGKYSLWEGGIRVPLLISWPGIIEENVVKNDYVSATDILPTLAKLTNFEIEDDKIDGMDLFTPEKERILVWKWQKNWAIRKGDWKLTNTKENHWKSEPSAQYIAPLVNNDSLKLFNLANDPSERLDLVKQHPEIVEALEIAYQNWCKENLGKY